MAQPDLVFIGIHGSVVAMDKETGKQVWMTRLKAGVFGGANGFVTLMVEADKVFAVNRGEMFCLDAASGNILWHDELSGMGYGLASIATRNNSANVAALAEEHHRQEQQDSSPPASST